MHPLIERCRKITFRTAWHHPFFAIPFQKLTLRVDSSIPTACVNAQGVVRINPDFASKIDDQTLAGTLAHEALHPLMRHFQRMAGRDPSRSNRAADRAINQILRESGLPLPSGVLYPESGRESWTFEQHYDVEPEGDGGDNDMDPGEYDPQNLPGEGEAGPGGVPSDDLPTSQDFREAAVQAVEVAKGAGKGSPGAYGKILEEPPSRVRWESLLRGAAARALAAHGDDITSYHRPNRRSGDIIMPVTRAQRALVAVVIDSSGSVDDKALTAAVKAARKICEIEPTVGIYLVVHDSTVQHAGWIRKGKSEIAKTIKGRGGTTFDPAYRAVEAAKLRFDAVVHLTDGGCCESTWPARPKNARNGIVALIGTAYRAGIPQTGWRVVEVEPPR